MVFPKLFTLTFDVDGDSLPNNRTYRTKREALDAIEAYIYELHRQGRLTFREDRELGVRFDFVDERGIKHFGLVEICPL